MIYDRSDLKLKILDQGDISKCTWLLQQPALEIALQYNFYYMDDIPHISFQSGFFSENFSVKLQEEKERENICYYTCDVFQHVKNQLELMTWNWIIPSIPIACAKILLILYVQKKSWKFRMVSANASCSPGVLTSFLDQLQKDTIWL